MKPPTLEDIIILAKTLYGEARGEPVAGQIAVAWVVRNRAEQALGDKAKGTKDRHQFGDGTAQGACLKPWQFSCWNHNDPNSIRLRTMPDDDPRIETCKIIAKDVLAGKVKDPTHGATFYYNPKVANPNWAKGQTPTAIIGNHRFYAGIA